MDLFEGIPASRKTAGESVYLSEILLYLTKVTRFVILLVVNSMV